MKIWYQSTLNFDLHPNYGKALRRHFQRVAGPCTEVLVHGRSAAFGSQLPVHDVIGSPVVYHAVVASAFIEAVMRAEDQGCDAFVVASFSEPILPELRALAGIPVISMTEATYMAGCMVAPRVGFVTLNKAVVPFIEKSMALHKWSSRVSGIHLVPGNVSEPDLEHKFDAPAPFLDLLVEGVREAIAAGAQVVIPAEGVLGVMAAENGLREVDGVPIVDPIATPVLFAEMAVNMARATGLTTSRAAYPQPSAAARDLLKSRY
ncbi:aspartate/glutamate racemase family protein [Ruixingdingia sedimenti]|uniref:Aspartate/glutamate racemase family protein n=1 Tax=Ruixingdingia sedimenti TaxID=3073604 RepID=A0ABU1F5R4_9RHOB|nr:aspartate/glutamate racemase family protein [Xinfangfangia sp. LG-4]MDR5652205.1 aspartate/glutamate racemase family protein [Xinfangfangia sp. LG-4]